MADDKIQKRIAKLEKILAKGRKKYILYYGVLGFGLSVAIISSIIEYFIREDFPSYLHFIVFPLVGIFEGPWMWSHLQEELKKLKIKANVTNIAVRSDINL